MVGKKVKGTSLATPESIASLLLSFPSTTEEQPFGPDVDVYKVAGKIFAIMSPESVPPSISLKCEPQRALELRDEFTSVTPGYHLNKTHWNSVALDGSVPVKVLQEMIEHSFDRVIAGMPLRQRKELDRHATT